MRKATQFLNSMSNLINLIPTNYTIVPTDQTRGPGSVSGMNNLITFDLHNSIIEPYMMGFIGHGGINILSEILFRQLSISNYSIEFAFVHSFEGAVQSSSRLFSLPAI